MTFNQLTDKVKLTLDQKKTVQSNVSVGKKKDPQIVQTLNEKELLTVTSQALQIAIARLERATNNIEVTLTGQSAASATRLFGTDKVNISHFKQAMSIILDRVKVIANGLITNPNSLEDLSSVVDIEKLIKETIKPIPDVDLEQFQSEQIIQLFALLLPALSLKIKTDIIGHTHIDPVSGVTGPGIPVVP